MRKIVAAMAAALGGCAANSDQLYTPTGAVGHNVDCSGVARNWGHCEQKAGEICKSAGYKVLSKTDERKPTLIKTETRVSDLFGSGEVARSMVIECN